jgi:GNAT superfamily N-acetyltransferase
VLTLRSLSTDDRMLLEDFVRDDPDYTRTNFDEDPSPQDVDSLLNGAPKDADPDSYRVLGAFAPDGILVGVLQSVDGWPTAVSCYLGLLQVHPAHRGQGVATALLATIERTARSMGRRQLLLSVIARNTDARAFWHRQGFHMLTPQKAGAAAPLDPVVMHKPLRPSAETIWDEKARS